MATVNEFPLSTSPLATVLASLNYALYKATSTTSLAIGTGSKVFTIQSGKDIAEGDFILASSDADVSNYMLGQVDSYSDTTLTMSVPAANYTGGSGTYADWTLRLSGPPGATGEQGIQGDPGSPGANGAISISGTPTVSQLAVWTDGTTQKGVSITGLVKGNGASDPTAAAAGTDYLAPAAIGVTVQAYDIDTAKLDVENQTLTGGVEVTSKALNSGSAVTSGTLTLDMADRPLQHYTNGGAHTLAPGSVAGACMVDITNNASAGAVTTSGWTKVVGSFTTTSGHKFRCHASVGNAGSLLIIQALQ